MDRKQIGIEPFIMIKEFEPVVLVCTNGKTFPITWWQRFKIWMYITPMRELSAKFIAESEKN